MGIKKSQKISTASDQYYFSYVKKTTGGGQIAPPPAGIGLNSYLQNNKLITRVAQKCTFTFTKQLSSAHKSSSTELKEVKIIVYYLLEEFFFTLIILLLKHLYLNIIFKGT